MAAGSQIHPVVPQNRDLGSLVTPVTSPEALRGLSPATPWEQTHRLEAHQRGGEKIAELQQQ